MRSDASKTPFASAVEGVALRDLSATCRAVPLQSLPHHLRHLLDRKHPASLELSRYDSEFGIAALHGRTGEAVSSRFTGRSRLRTDKSCSARGSGAGPATRFVSSHTPGYLQ